MLRRLPFVLALLLVLAACGTDQTVDDEADAGGAAAGTDEPSETSETEDAVPVAEEDELGEGVIAVTTVFPLADLARALAPGAEVTLLTSSGQDPHDLELSPADRALLESADVVLYLGDIDFQPQVEAAVADATGEVVAVAEIVGAGALRELDGHDHDDDGHGHDDDHADDHADDDHGGEAVDPHVWFDAGLMAEVAGAIGAGFAAADADRADDYEARAQEQQEELLALEAEIDELLSDCTRDVAVVSHEAYAYLLEPRDLEQEGISGAGGHGDASPQRLAELTERIRAEGIPAVLTEPLEGRADAEALADEAGVELLEIDPLEIGTDELFAQGYPDALRAQASAFAEALECGA